MPLPQAIESPPGELPGRHQVRALALRLRARLSKFHQRPSGTLLATVRTTDKCRNRQTTRSEEHTSELQSRLHLVCRLLLEKKNKFCGIETLDHDCEW